MRACTTGSIRARERLTVLERPLRDLRRSSRHGGRWRRACVPAARAAVLAPPGRSPPASRALPARLAAVCAAAIHVHTRPLDGTRTPRRRRGRRREPRRAAVRHRARTMVTAPGRRIRRAYRDGVLCIDAVEISTEGGHYVALGLAARRRIGSPASRATSSRTSRASAASAIVAHPESPKADLRWTRLDAAVRRHRVAQRRQRVAGRARSVAAARARRCIRSAAPETIAAMFDRPPAPFARWDSLARCTAASSGVAGHDAHARIGLRGNWEPARRRRVAAASRRTRRRFARSRSPSRCERRSPATPRATRAALVRAHPRGHALHDVDALAGPADVRLRGDERPPARAPRPATTLARRRRSRSRVEVRGTCRACRIALCGTAASWRPWPTARCCGSCTRRRTSRPCIASRCASPAAPGAPAGALDRRQPDLRRTDAADRRRSPRLRRRRASVLRRRR